MLVRYGLLAAKGIGGHLEREDAPVGVQFLAPERSGTLRRATVEVKAHHRSPLERACEATAFKLSIPLLAPLPCRGDMTPPPFPRQDGGRGSVGGPALP